MKRKVVPSHSGPTNHKRNGRHSRHSQAIEIRPFPPRMPLGQFLFEYLHRRGVRHSFGVPGDFALPTFAWLEKSKQENAVGFTYSRVDPRINNLRADPRFDELIKRVGLE